MGGTVQNMDPVAQLATLFLFITGAALIPLIVGTALFYGGLGGTRRGSRTLFLAFVTLAVVVLVWIAYGYGAAFGTPLIAHWIGNPLSHPGLTGLSSYEIVFAGFQGLVAAFAVVLVLGSRQGMVRLGPWVAFAVLWVSLVYVPVAYGVFNDLDGWAGQLLQVNDFAGGIAVQVCAGAAALALSLAVRPIRSIPFPFPERAVADEDAASEKPDDGASVFAEKAGGFGRAEEAAGAAPRDEADGAGAGEQARDAGPGRQADAPALPHPTIRLGTPVTMIGAALMLFGWFGLDAGSEAVVDGVAALAWVNTLAAAAAGTFSWVIVQAIRERKPTFTGAAFGAIAGLAAVSSVCNDIAPGWAIVLGIAAATPCVLIVEWPPARWLCGSALPVVGIHLVAGLIGALYVGLFGEGIGLIDAGNFDQLAVQGIAAFGVMFYSFGITWVIARALDKTVGLRMRTQDRRITAS